MTRPAAGQVVNLDAVRVINEHPDATRVPRLWSRRALAGRLSVSGEWIDTWRKRGLLKAIVLHAEPDDRGVILYREEDVVRFLRARGIEPDEEGRP